jgi:hypothetical protein
VPFKDFNAGEVLTASDVDTYLMSQVIIRCTSGTRPASPAEGWHIYETDTNRLMVYNGSAWIPQGGGFIYAYKASSESNTSSSFHTDNALVIPVAANTRYWLEAFIAVRVNSTGATYTPMRWTVPSGTTMLWGSQHLVNDATGALEEGLMNSRVFSESDQINHYTVLSTGTTVFIKGTVNVGGTAGNLSFQWSADSDGRTVLAGSLMRLSGLY